VGVPYLFAKIKHELIEERPKEKESGKIDPSRRKAQKTEG